jgi:hypothetical protein
MLKKHQLHTQKRRKTKHVRNKNIAISTQAININEDIFKLWKRL